MSFLKRLSGSVWSLVSTPSGDATPPTTSSPSLRPAPLGKGKSHSATTTSNKRRHSHISSPTSSGPRRKSRKTDHDKAYSPDDDSDSDESMDDDPVLYSDENSAMSTYSNILVASSPISGDVESDVVKGEVSSTNDETKDADSKEGFEEKSEETEGGEPEEDAVEVVELSEEDPELDESLVTTDEDWAMAERRKKFLIPDRPENHNDFKQALQTAGWNDDHISLVTHIRLRGHEPLLPDYFKNSYPYIPDSLFATGNKYLIGPHKYDGTPSPSPLVAISRLFDLGPKIRTAVSREDADGRNNQYSPESYTRRLLQEYMKWAVRDASDVLYPKAVIPTITIVDVEYGTLQTEILAMSLHRLRRLANRWKNALTVEASIEAGPSTSPTASDLMQPIPTLYCFIASRGHVVLMAYRSERDSGFMPNEDGDAEMETEKRADGTRVIAGFNMEEKNHDVWNCFAFALVICHSRDVQLRIARDTGVAARTGTEPESDDPDL